jgi:membrane protein implicated in regulation of membrane protease activity
MQQIVDFFIGLGGWSWFVLAVVMLIVETVIPGIHFMWFGTAAVVVGALALAIGPAFPWQWQLALFGLISVVSIYLVRRYWRAGDLVTDEPHLNVRGSQYIGRVFTVEEAIVAGRGRVRVGDTLWTAEGPDSAVGDKVKVTGINGTVLVVEAT